MDKKMKKILMDGGWMEKNEKNRWMDMEKI